MDFMTFEYLVLKLTAFLQFTADTFVRSLISIRKQVALVIFSLVHGYSYKAMNNMHNCSKSTIKKYKLVICKVFSR
jgi:hypothetical protein